jgi:hypothetical protein
MKVFIGMLLMLIIITEEAAFAQGIDTGSVEGTFKKINYEDSIASNFKYAIADIKKKLSRILPANQQKLLRRVKVTLDTTYFGLELNSSSTDRTINYNWGIFKTFSRDQLAYFLSQNQGISGDIMDIFNVSFNRPNFYYLYSTYLNRISVDIDIKEQAELDEEQLIFLQNSESSDKFRWVYKRRLVFAFLHEFYHQVQNYDRLKIGIENSKLTRQQKNDKLLQLEIDADAYTYRIAPKLKIVPVNYTEVVHLFGVFRGNKLLTEAELNKRKQAYLTLLVKNCKIDLAKLGYDCQALRREVRYARNDMEDEQAFFDFQKKTFAKRTEAVMNKDIGKLYHVGNVFLYRNTLVAKNLDSAFYYLSLVSLIGKEKFPESDSLYTSKLKDMFELSSLLAGKILELNKKDARALEYYTLAKRVSRYMPRDFYDRMIERVSMKYKEKISR